MNKKLGLIVCATALQFLHAGAQAGVIVSIQQVGSDALATGSGSLDLAGSPLVAALPSPSSFISPNNANLGIGIGLSPEFIVLYDAIATGPASFGSGAGDATLTGSGPPLGLLGSGLIFVPLGYMSGTGIFAVSSFSGQTLNTLGANPGSYSFTLNSGDFFTVQIIGPFAAVPKPSSVALMLVASHSLVAWAHGAVAAAKCRAKVLRDGASYRPGP